MYQEVGTINKINVLAFIMIKYVFLFVGSFMTAIGIEVFFKAHNLVAGGVMGISVILSYLIEIPLGILIIFLNFPIVVNEYLQHRKIKVLPILFVIASFIFWVSVINTDNWGSHNILQSAIFGGISLGVGSGLILRYGGLLDGIEHKRLIAKSGLNNQGNSFFILLNILILASSGFLLGWESALYSLLAYLLFFYVIDLTMKTLNRSERIYR